MAGFAVNFLGDKLRLLRLFHGHSLEEVGALVGATRQYVHQLETGAKLPSSAMEEALADGLSVLAKYFRSPPQNAVKEEQCHFRKQLTTRVSLTQQVLARATLLDELVSKLATRLEFPRVNFPDAPAGEEVDDIERAAEKCRQHWHLGLSGPITSMTRVVENAGAVVTHFGTLSEKVDALSISRRRPIILLNSTKESACRHRFDLAHECGHIVMHQGIVTGDRTTEEQANRFASAFLLPRIAFAREFPRGDILRWNELFALKLRWKVSVRAIIRRAFDLRLIDAAKYRRANIHLMKSGQSRREQHDDQIPIELPELLETALSTLETKRPGSLVEVAFDMGLASGAYERLTGRSLPLVPTSAGTGVIFLQK